MDTFEYRIRQINDSVLDSPETVMNKMGEQGWEAVGTLGDSYTVIFKRKVKKESCVSG